MEHWTKIDQNHFISAMNFSYSESADEAGGGTDGFVALGTFPMLWDWLSADEAGGGTRELLAQGTFAMLWDWSEVETGMGAEGGGGGGTAL